MVKGSGAVLQVPYGKYCATSLPDIDPPGRGWACCEMQIDDLFLHFATQDASQLTMPDHH
jgi:hypothetical protein